MLSELDDESHDKILSWVLTPRTFGIFGDNDSFISETGLQDLNVDYIRSAVMMIVNLMSDSSLSADNFISLGAAQSMFSEDDIPGLRRFVDKLEHRRDDISRHRDVFRAESSVLPTLVDIEFALDARVIISDGQLVHATPVVIGYLDTDTENQLVCFQLNELRVKEIRDRLTSILNDIDVLKSWIESR